jgi:hypothetical protein
VVKLKKIKPRVIVKKPKGERQWNTQTKQNLKLKEGKEGRKKNKKRQGKQKQKGS